MSLYPVYDPKSFDGIDLRKYHIRTIKDVIKFHEFVASRMEEAQFILKKFNNQYSTFETVSAQLQAKLEAQQRTYGAAPKVEETQDTAPEIQAVDRSVEQEHEALLDDIRQAVAEESLIKEVEANDDNEPLKAILGKYKLIYGKKGPMYYRENDKGQLKLVSKKDVPEDVKQALLNSVGKDE